MADANDFTNFVSKYWIGNDSILQTTITSHLYIEQSINDFLAVIFKQPELLTKASFNHKIDIIEATGLITKDSLDRLRQINKLRNKFAHNLEYVLTYKDVQALHVKKATKNEWDNNHLLCLRLCFSYAVGMLHTQVVITEKLKKEGKIKL